MKCMYIIISKVFTLTLPIKNKINNNKHVISNFKICNYKKK